MLMFLMNVLKDSISYIFDLCIVYFAIFYYIIYTLLHRLQRNRTTCARKIRTYLAILVIIIYTYNTSHGR